MTVGAEAGALGATVAPEEDAPQVLPMKACGGEMVVDVVVFISGECVIVNVDVYDEYV